MTAEAEPSAASKLCSTCGLCCNGVMFHTVRLQPADSPKALTALGLKLKRRNGDHEIQQPCPAHCGSSCRIYTARPTRCRVFECQQVKGVDSGRITESAALAVIQEALDKTALVNRLLQEAGHSDPRRPLSKRYEKIMIDLLSDPSTDHRERREELTAAMEDLDRTLDQDFRIPRPGDIPAETEEPIRVAVYGTLMQGQGGQELAGVAGGMTYLGPCQLRGDLYDLGEYPGLVEGDGWIRGEVFSLRDRSVLQRLDAYEGCVEGNPSSLFIRRSVHVAGHEESCWVYYYNGTAGEGVRVANGDWAAYTSVRKACS